MKLSRRVVLFTGLAASLAPLRALAAPGAQVHVVKDPGCPCCEDWVAHLQDAGLVVTVEVREAAALNAYKAQVGLPAELASCHTATASGYVIEGHVPAADIQRLLDEAPDALGLAVPGMPLGSPGMGPEDQREAYDVVLFRADGTREVFAQYPAA